MTKKLQKQLRANSAVNTNQHGNDMPVAFQESDEFQEMLSLMFKVGGVALILSIATWMYAYRILPQNIMMIPATKANETQTSASSDVTTGAITLTTVFSYLMKSIAGVFSRRATANVHTDNPYDIQTYDRTGFSPNAAGYNIQAAIQNGVSHAMARSLQSNKEATTQYGSTKPRREVKSRAVPAASYENLTPGAGFSDYPYMISVNQTSGDKLIVYVLNSIPYTANVTSSGLQTISSLSAVTILTRVSDSQRLPDGTILIIATAMRSGDSSFDMYDALIDEDGTVLRTFTRRGNTLPGTQSNSRLAYDSRNRTSLTYYNDLTGDYFQALMNTTFPSSTGLVGSATKINTSPNAITDKVMQIESTGNNTFINVFQQDGGIYTVRTNSTGTFLQPQMLLSADTINNRMPCTAVLPNNDILITWFNPTTNEFAYRSYQISSQSYSVEQRIKFNPTDPNNNGFSIVSFNDIARIQLFANNLVGYIVPVTALTNGVSQRGTVYGVIDVSTSTVLVPPTFTVLSRIMDPYGPSCFFEVQNNQATCVTVAPNLNTAPPAPSPATVKEILPLQSIITSPQTNINGFNVSAYGEQTLPTSLRVGSINPPCSMTILADDTFDFSIDSVTTSAGSKTISLPSSDLNTLNNALSTLRIQAVQNEDANGILSVSFSCSNGETVVSNVQINLIQKYLPVSFTQNLTDINAKAFEKISISLSDAVTGNALPFTFDVRLSDENLLNPNYEMLITSSDGKQSLQVTVQPNSQRSYKISVTDTKNAAITTEFTIVGAAELIRNPKNKLTPQRLATYVTLLTPIIGALSTVLVCLVKGCYLRNAELTLMEDAETQCRDKIVPHIANGIASMGMNILFTCDPYGNKFGELCRELHNILWTNNPNAKNTTTGSCALNQFYENHDKARDDRCCAGGCCMSDKSASFQIGIAIRNFLISKNDAIRNDKCWSATFGLFACQKKSSNANDVINLLKSHADEIRTIVTEALMMNPEDLSSGNSDQMKASATGAIQLNEIPSIKDNDASMTALTQQTADVGSSDSPGRGIRSV